MRFPRLMMVNRTSTRWPLIEEVIRLDSNEPLVIGNRCADNKRSIEKRDQTLTILSQREVEVLQAYNAPLSQNPSVFYCISSFSSRDDISWSSHKSVRSHLPLQPRPAALQRPIGCQEPPGRWISTVQWRQVFSSGTDHAATISFWIDFFTCIWMTLKTY